MTADSQIREHDAVALTCAVGSWPAGTIGCVVSDRDGYLGIEIADDQGRMLDLLFISAGQCRRTWRFPVEDFRGPHAKEIGALLKVTVDGRFTELDVVALKQRVGRWEAGTEGTVTEDHGGAGKPKMVEVEADDGQVLDRLLLPEDQLRLTWKFVGRGDVAALAHQDVSQL